MTHRMYSFRFMDDEYTMIYIRDSATAKRAVEALNAKAALPDAPIRGLDIETAKIEKYLYTDELKKSRKTGLCPHLTRQRLVQVYTGLETIFVFDLFHVDKNIIFDMLRRGKYVAHNAQFEQSHFSHMGLDSFDLECSMIAAITVDRAEHSPFEPLGEYEDEQKPNPMTGFGLDACCARYLGQGISKEHQVSDWGAPELSIDQLIYATLDAIACQKIHAILKPQIEEMGMKNYFNILNKMLPVVAEMCNSGMSIDRDAHEALMDTWNAEVKDKEEDIRGYFPDVNLNSPKQLGIWLEENHPTLCENFPRTEKGAYSFNKNGLTDYLDIPAFQCLVDYKKHTKLLSTYGEGLLESIHPKTHKIHSDFSLGETRTGRMSSRNPNSQNYPRDKSFRSIFTAGIGKKLICYDLSQIEIRVAACLSGDNVMLNAFRNGIDLHRLIVHNLTGKRMDAITSNERQMGKALNFGLQFGMGGKGLKKYMKASYGIDMSEQEAWDAYNVYHNTYKGYSDWCGRCRDFTKIKGYTTTPAGKRRKLTDDEAYTRSVNCPVQGGAAEALMCGLIILFNRIRANNFQDHILSLIHI